MAIKVTRRTVAVAVFRGRNLNYAEVRHLSSNKEAANVSATGFVNWMLTHFRIESVVLEDAVASDEVRSAELLQHLERALRAGGMLVRRVTKSTLIESFAAAPLKSRSEFRKIVRDIWPQLDSRDFHPSVYDAASLGLYMQVECLLSQ
jgi:hypothetical protein